MRQADRQLLCAAVPFEWFNPKACAASCFQLPLRKQIPCRPEWQALTQRRQRIVTDASISAGGCVL